MSAMTPYTPSRLPPRKTVSLFAKIQNNFFNTPVNSFLTVLFLYIAYLVVPPLLDWALLSAVWAPDHVVCQESDGACWGFIDARFRLILLGTYPADEQWRPYCAMSTLLLTVFLTLARFSWGVKILSLVWLISAIIVGILMQGGVFGLAYVENTQWGGLPLTLILTTIGIIFSFPVGVALALGRQSNLVAVRTICVVFIEIVRGVPLITVLFMASVMFPLFLPEGVTIDKLLRAQIGIVLFSSAYVAEIVRGGLQAIPKGQFEAADSLGLSYWQSRYFVILPQVIKLVIPPMVGSFISLLKDTSLVSIVSLFDLLGTVKLALADPKWRAFHAEGYIFAALIFFILCFSMALYSKYLEKKLKTNHRM